MTELAKQGSTPPELLGVEELAHTLFADVLSPEGKVLGANDDIVVANSLHDLITDPANTVATLRDESQNLRGFSVAIPISAMDTGRTSEGAQTAYIYFTGVEPAYQGRGLVGELMKDMLQQLRTRGYGFIERDSRVDNGYADDVEKAYQDGIVTKYDYHPYGEDLQRFMRIDLSKIP